MIAVQLAVSPISQLAVCVFGTPCSSRFHCFPPTAADAGCLLLPPLLPPWMQRLPMPDSCPAFLRQLIQDCWAEDPAARPAFPAIRQRLRQELDRVAGDSAQQAQRTACRSTLSEADADASSAVQGCSGSHTGWPDSGCGGSGSGGCGALTPVAGAPPPSPFADHPSSVSGGLAS